LVQLTSLSIAGFMVSTTGQQQQQQQQQDLAAPGSCPALPQLVDLRCRLCNFSRAAFQQLASSAGLTALDVQLVRCEDSPQPAAAAGMAPPSTEFEAALRACRGLRSLTLVDPAVLEGLSEHAAVKSSGHQHAAAPAAA
jgi:hypothetical protein